MCKRFLSRTLRSRVNLITKQVDEEYLLRYVEGADVMYVGRAVGRKLFRNTVS
ncbi:hypothetical protein P879_11398 [Paragonimus westermani]|uniref:Uncharacterized protein n=1 Tax=Paragonimus westermani TaxID=34504 RepID=A0A8T0D838_9TREM|nr:hypothetical protein P879_11398 [Paragonimus westermani]